MRLAGRTLLRPRFLVFVVLLWSLVTFLPAIQNDFVNWDDFRMFLDNPAHRGTWEDRLRGAWASHRLGEYMPVTWMTYGADRSFWGDSPAGYHFTSLLLHAVTTVAVMALGFRLLRHALGDEPGDDDRWGLWLGATVAALVFAVHPLRVEPVTWVSARGTVLGGLFLVLSVLAYVEGWKRGRGSGRMPPLWLVGSLMLFALSLLARATGLVLPLVLMVLDVYPLRRVGGRPSAWFGSAARAVWAEKIGFGLLGLLTIPMAYFARGEEVGGFWRGGYDPSVAVTWGVYSLGFYVWKTLLPGNLSPVYPMPEGHAPMVAPVLASFALVAGATAGVLAIRRRWAGPLTAWIVYIILITPLSGILPFGRLRGVADRYSYLACIGGAIVAGGAATIGWRRFRNGDLRRRWAAVVAIGLVSILVAWSVLSWYQTKVWRNGLTLWGWAEEIHGDSPVVHNNLGWAWAHAGEYRRAEIHARRAAEMLPNSATVLQTLGRILAAQGRLEESVEVLRRAVAVSPQWPEGHIGLGSVLYESGDVPRAVEALERAVALDPGDGRAHYYLGRVLLSEGRREEAETHLRRAMEIHRGVLGPLPVAEAVKQAPVTGSAFLPEPASGGFRPRRRRGPPGRRSGGPRAGEPTA